MAFVAIFYSSCPLTKGYFKLPVIVKLSITLYCSPYEKDSMTITLLLLTLNRAVAIILVNLAEQRQ